MNKKYFIPILVMVMFLFMFAAGCAPDEEPAEPVDEPEEVEAVDGEPIKIGVVGPMDFIQGEHHWFGAQLAQEEINERGGVMVGEQQRPIELIQADTNEILSVEDAISAVERVITRDGVDFIVGGFRTESVLGMQDVAMDYQTIFMGCGAIHPELCNRVAEDYDRYKYWFRVTPLNSYNVGEASFHQLENVAEIMLEDLGIEELRVALLFEMIVGWDPILEEAQDRLPEMGMEIVGTWRPSQMADDVRSELTAIENAEAHLIFSFLSGPVGVAFGRQWGEMEVPAAVVGVNVEAQKAGYWEATAGHGEYDNTLNFYGGVEINELSLPFWERFQERFGEHPIYNAGTYEAILILAEAIERAGTIDPDAVVDELEQTDMELPQGRVVFTEDHDISWGPDYSTTVGSQWLDGELKVVWPWGWEGITYDGTVRYRIPPWVVEKWQ